MAIGRSLATAFMLSVALAGPASAGWREDLGVFRIGMIAPADDAAPVIRDAYSTALGMPVEIFVARDYAALMDAQASARIEYAIHSAVSYATLSQLCSCVEPLVAPVSDSGATGIRSVLIARPEGPRSADALAGYRVALGAPDSASGYLLPLAQFSIGGVALTGAEPFLVPVATESDAEARLVTADVDAMFGYVPSSGAPSTEGGTLERLAAAGLEDARILWSSDLLRFGPHAIRTNLAGEAKEILATFLTGLREQDEPVYDLLERRFGGGFLPVTQDDYRAAREIARKVGGAPRGD